MSRLHRRGFRPLGSLFVVLGLLCCVTDAAADKVLLGARAAQAQANLRKPAQTRASTPPSRGQSEARAATPGSRAQGPASAHVAKQPVRSPTTAPERTRGPSPTELRAERLGLGDIKAAGQLLAGRAEPHWVRAAAGGDRLPGTLRFPVAKGYATRGFGSGKGGYHQAVDIGGEIGVKVRASAAGIVGYAGNGVSGYGNMVILVHAGGAITTYAHNQKNLVVSGQKVSKGAVIGLLGSTGRSKGPHVHFELLFQGKNCDPMPLFRPAALRKNGAPAAPGLSSWKHANKRPKAIRCFPRKHHPDYIARPQTFEDEDEGGSDPSQP